MELLITLLAGISILFGALLVHLFHDTERIENFSMAMALAALLALMVVDLLPEVRETASGLGWIASVLLVAAGFVLLKLLDFFVPEHEDTEENHDTGNAVHIGLMSALAIILHNIVEGMTVYSVAMTSIRQGLIFAIGIALHNIPMGLLIESTTQKEKRAQHALILTLVTASTLIGGFLMYSVSGYLTENVIGMLVCLATGMIIYIVFAELLPHVLRTRQHGLNILGTLMGFAIVFASSIVA
ncbi:MAG: ZIP family metal transporter [Eubacterium sp.]|nr:ZIP family metal transporter [Eubacterium sp.]